MLPPSIVGLVQYPHIIVWVFLHNSSETGLDLTLRTQSDFIFVQKYLGNTDYEWVTIYLVDRSQDLWETETGIQFQSSHG